MRNFILASSLLFSFALLFASCGKDENFNLKDLVFNVDDIPDSLAVYELIDGERKKSTIYRLLTDEEFKALVKRGWVSNNRAFFCHWADQPNNQMTCGEGTTRCGVISAPVNQRCLGCFDADGNLINAGNCRAAQ